MVLIVAAMLAVPLFPMTCAHSQQAPLTAAELLETTALKAHVKALEKGEIIVRNRPETEVSNELNVIMAVLVPVPLDKTVDTLQRQSAAEKGTGIHAAGEIRGSTPPEMEQAFAPVMFTAEEKEEVRRMMTIEAGDQCNFSTEEIALINRKAEALKGEQKDGPAAIEAMSKAMRDVLKGRYLAYRSEGLDGLAPYQFGPDKQVAPSVELSTATEAMRLLQERFPEYHNCLRYYPAKKGTTYVHQFYWAKQAESNRPLFLLKHWILDIRPDYALIAERRFYLSHSLNSLQVVIGCLPHGDSTLVILLNQTFTEKVNMNIGKMIAKTIGYREVEKNIRPIFENLRNELRH
jgi:hypothetical protein